MGLLIIVASLLILDRHALKTVDWGLLATFAAFFTFSGNMARIETVRVFFQQLLAHSAMLVSALTSQIISNVPAAILLSRFTDDYRGLLVGVNVGGAGTLVASLASLITFCEYTKRLPRRAGGFCCASLPSVSPCLPSCWPQWRCWAAEQPPRSRKNVFDLPQGPAFLLL